MERTTRAIARKKVIGRILFLYFIFGARFGESSMYRLYRLGWILAIFYGIWDLGFLDRITGWIGYTGCNMIWDF